MKSLYQLFNEDNNTKQNQQNIRVPAKIKEQKRKTRVDKKKDVKIPLTIEQRKLLKRLAKKNNTDPTYFSSYLIKKALTRKLIIPEPPVPYNPKERLTTAKLELYYHDLLFEKSIDLDCKSLRSTAYRILSYMLIIESGGIHE